MLSLVFYLHTWFWKEGLLLELTIVSPQHPAAMQGGCGGPAVHTTVLCPTAAKILKLDLLIYPSHYI